MALIARPATQDFKPRKTTRETRGHVIVTPAPVRRGPVRHSVGEGVWRLGGGPVKKILFFFLEVFKGFVEDEDGDDETININR